MVYGCRWVNVFWTHFSAVTHEGTTPSAIITVNKLHTLGFTVVTAIEVVAVRQRECRRA